MYPCINISIPFFRRQGTLLLNANVYFHDAKTNRIQTIAMLIISYILFFITLIRCFCNCIPASFGAGNYKTGSGIVVFPVPAGYRRLIELQTICTHILSDLNNRIALKSQPPHCFHLLGRGAVLFSV